MQNGIIEIDDDSSTDDENDTCSNRSYDENSSCKKEDQLSDEKTRLGDRNAKTDETNETNNLFENDSSKSRLRLTPNSNDNSRDNFSETNSKSPHDSRSSNEDTASRLQDTNVEAGESAEENDASDHSRGASTEPADDDDNADEDARCAKQHGVNSCDTLPNSPEDGGSETTDDVDLSGKDTNEVSRTNDHSDVQMPSKTSEEPTKEPDKDTDSESADNKRPASQESIASASSSSERTLTIRSASQVNKMVSSSSDVVVKSELAGEKIDKPGISVLNPSQLGINVVPNTSFPPPTEPQMSYMSSGLPNGSNSYQCDVCETTFADSIVLEDHKANSGHYRCHFSSECATYVFPNMTELLQHQQTYHGVMPQSPVQRLQHQVQNLPVRYQLDQPANMNYQSMAPYPQTSVSPARNSLPPSMYPSPPNKLSSRQNPNNNLRIQYSSVRGQVPMANPANQTMKRGATAPSPRMMMATKRRWNGDVDCKVVSVQKPDNNDDVVAQLSKSITITTRQESQKKNETAAVANMLATRGITVSQVPAKTDANSNALTMLNLNSAVSLIPTNKNSNFAVPQGRAGAGRPPLAVPSNRMQTVDLTGPEMSRRSLNRQGSNRFTCQICDRAFGNSEQLQQHMLTHRSTTSRKQLPYRCGSCGAQYPNQQSLIHHKQTCKIGVTASTSEMVIPVVDLKQPGAIHRLQSNGFNYVIPVNALGSQSSNGTFGIPILPLSSGNNLLNMTNCGISNILPVGPLRTLGHFGR